MTTEKRIEVGVVLQGGGALGAYQGGALTALLELLDELESAGRSVTLKAVTGVSIGAVNAACVVGSADREDARRRLRALWNHLRHDLAELLPREIQAKAAWWGLPGFFTPRADWWNWFGGTYTYDTSPLSGTLTDHVDFDALNASPTACVVTAVDVDTGRLTRFRNARAALAAKAARPGVESGFTPVTGDTDRIDPRHILASGSLPPFFSWTSLEGQVYWDGALVDNTPLGDAIEAFTPGIDVERLLVVMNLFPLSARRPADRDQVQDRIDELKYGNRLLQDRKSAERINRLAGLIDTLARLVPDDRYTQQLRDDVDEARLYKKVRIVPIDLQNPTAGSEPSAQDPADGNGGHGDFSPRTVRRRFEGGYRVARRILTGELFAPPASDDHLPVAAMSTRDVPSAEEAPGGPDTVLGIRQLSRN